MSLDPQEFQRMLDEIEASRASRRRAWENLQEIRWVIKDATGIDLPPPERKTIDLEGRVVKDGVRRTAGGAPEFVVPNGPIQPNATIKIIGPMMKLQPNEQVLTGTWLVEKGQARRDAIGERIEWLIFNHLQKIVDSPQMGSLGNSLSRSR